VTSDQDIVLSLLNNSVGIPEEEFPNRASEEGVEHPQEVLSSLQERGLVREDEGKNGRPTRLKLTNRYFEQ
jgi:hypothetical protein